jgi:hypothetical protein
MNFTQKLTNMIKNRINKTKPLVKTTVIYFGMTGTVTLENGG